METSTIAHRSLTNGVYSFKHISPSSVGFEIENTTPDHKPIAYRLEITNPINVHFISANETTTTATAHHHNSDTPSSVTTTTLTHTFEGFVLRESKEEIVRVEVVDPKSPWSFDHRLTWSFGDVQIYVDIKERRMGVNVSQQQQGHLTVEATEQDAAARQLLSLRETRSKFIDFEFPPLLTSLYIDPTDLPKEVCSYFILFILFTHFL